MRSYRHEYSRPYASVTEFEWATVLYVQKCVSGDVDEHEDNMHVEWILIYCDVTSDSAGSICNNISIMIKRIATIHH